MPAPGAVSEVINLTAGPLRVHVRTGPTAQWDGNGGKEPQMANMEVATSSYSIPTSQQATHPPDIQDWTSSLVEERILSGAPRPHVRPEELPEMARRQPPGAPEEKVSPRTAAGTGEEDHS